MAKYKEIKVDMQVTPEMILEQLLIQNRKKVEPAQNNIRTQNKDTKVDK